jgi:malonyl-CoA O-methyltransferase
MSDIEFRLDRALLRRRFGRAAAGAAVDPLAREIARRMDERLDYLRMAPQRILDLGCGTGTDLATLAARYPQALLLGADFAPAMLARAQAGQPRSGVLRRLLGGPPRGAALFAADALALPLARGSVDMLWSNLMLPAVDDPLPALREMHRVLAVGGVLMFSSFGPDTLRELRAVLPTDAGERVHRFIDMHDIGDALVKAGFSDPVMDMEMLTLTYPDLDALLRDLRAHGLTNASIRRPRGLSGRGGWRAARAAYERLRRDGRLPASFEVIQGHAWKTAPRTTADGRAVVSFQPRPPRATAGREPT